MPAIVPGIVLIRKWVLFLAANLMLFSCTFRNEEEIFENQTCDTEGVSYNGFIKPLLTSKCVSCHNASFPSANVILDDYNQLQVHVENGRFRGSVRHDPGFAAMPQGGSKLPACDIAKIEKWIQEGSPNN